MAIASKASDTSDMTKQELYQLQEKYAALQSKNEELLRENIDLHQNVKEMEVLIEGLLQGKIILFPKLLQVMTPVITTQDFQQWQFLMLF